MNKIVLFFLFSFLACSSVTQNRAEAIYKNNQKLLVIARNYADSNPNDSRAADIILKVTQIENTISDHMNTVSNGSYTSMGVKQKLEYVHTFSENDSKLKVLNRELIRAYRDNHSYFSDVDANYRSTLNNFRAAVASGRYGAAKKRRRN